MSAGEFQGRVSRALRDLLTERRIRQREVAELKGSTEGAIWHQLGNRAAIPVPDLEIYAKALGMSPAQLMRELARRITVLEAADAKDRSANACLRTTLSDLLELAGVA